MDTGIPILSCDLGEYSLIHFCAGSEASKEVKEGSTVPPSK